MISLNLPPAPISSLCAVALGAFYLRLALAVITLRRQHKVRLGTGQHADLELDQGWQAARRWDAVARKSESILAWRNTAP